jgi:hypothetical protein
MEVRFAWLEVLVAHMATRMKSNAFEYRKAKEKWPIFGSDVNLIYFCGAKFSKLMALNEYILNVSRSHVDGNHVGGFNSIKMFSMATLMTRVNV